MNPNCIYLNRGNHESAELANNYGFGGEVKSKYCADTYLLFLNSFKYLPLAHIVDDWIFVVHGGLTDNTNTTIKDI